jgi:hypothetical protein
MFRPAYASLALFCILLIAGAGCGRKPPQRTVVGTYMAERRDRVQDMLRLDPSGTFTQEIVALTGQKFGGAGRWRLVDQKVTLEGLLELKDAMVITQAKAFVKVDALGFDALVEHGEEDAGHSVFRRIKR